MEFNAQSSNQQTASAEIDLRRVFKSILKNIWKIAVISVLCGSIFLFVSYQFITPMYKTSTTFYVNNKLPLNGINTNISSNDLVTSISLVNSYIAILDNRDILKEVAEHANVDLDHNQLSGMISAAAVAETGVFKVTVIGSDPVEAAIIANSVGHIITTQICEIIEGSSVKIIDYPIVPTAPYSPSHIKNTVLGMFIGLLISAGIIALMEIFDSKIKSEDDLLHYCKYPILSVVPDMNMSSMRGYYKKQYGGYYSNNAGSQYNNDTYNGILGKNLNFATAEAYKLLRTKLQYSLADNQKCHIFLVSSAIPGEGKSVSSINLAYSLSQLGKRVLLIDGDMRRPTLASKLSISNYPGLSEYLTGFMGMDELLQEYTEDNHTVHILTAGSIPPNPIELLNSAKMTQAMELLQKQFDYIILDTPPVGEVSDALVVSKFSDGVLLVVRHNYCNRAALCDALQQFEFVNSRILGVVFNCFGDTPNRYSNHKYSDQYGSHYASRQQPSVQDKAEAKQSAEVQ